jgi:hypothetical protein
MFLAHEAEPLWWDNDVSKGIYGYSMMFELLFFVGV